jgi:hypothetical protein
MICGLHKNPIAATQAAYYHAHEEKKLTRGTPAFLAEMTRLLLGRGGGDVEIMEPPIADHMISAQVYTCCKSRNCEIAPRPGVLISVEVGLLFCFEFH